MDGGGADYQIAVAQILCVVADGYGDAQGAQVLDRGAVVHVGALDDQAHAPQDFCQRTHGHAADANQMDPLTRDQKRFNRGGTVHHKMDFLSKTAPSALRTGEKRCIIKSTLLYSKIRSNATGKWVKTCRTCPNTFKWC